MLHRQGSPRAIVVGAAIGYPSRFVCASNPLKMGLLIAVGKPAGNRAPRCAVPSVDQCLAQVAKTKKAGAGADCRTSDRRPFTEAEVRCRCKSAMQLRGRDPPWEDATRGKHDSS
jgi:hypothetical protein